MNDIERIWDTIAPYGNVIWGAKRDREYAGGQLYSAERLVRAANQLCTRGFDFYVGLNPARLRGKKARRSDCFEFRQLLLDIDPVAEEYDAQAALEQALVIASDVYVDAGGHGNVGDSATIIDSGRGMQAWLQFDPIRLEDDAHRIAVEASCAEFLRRISQALGTSHGCRVDTRTSDLPRIARCPESTNSKTLRHASVIHEHLWRLGRLDRLHGLEQVVRPLACPVLYEAGQVRGLKRVLPCIHPLAQDFLCYGTSEPGRHAAAYHTAAELVKVGVPEDVALLWVANGLDLCWPRLPRTEANRIVRNAYRRESESRIC
jgi:hypothetical protein